jgi:hypothetical protein
MWESVANIFCVSNMVETYDSIYIAFQLLYYMRHILLYCVVYGLINEARADMGNDREGLVRIIAAELESGLKTQVEPFPETEKEFADILAQLRQLDPSDLKGKLIVAGFLNHPYGTDGQRCMECMYYLVHRKWCDLPELAVPVEPQWWCRLWRI